LGKGVLDEERIFICGGGPLACHPKMGSERELSKTLFSAMTARVKRFAVWPVPAIIIGVLACALLLPSGPVIRDTPFMRELSRIHQICSKIGLYAQEHPASSEGNMSNMNVDDLAAASILSSDDATYIRDHHIQFRGYPSRIAGDVPVLETIYTNTRIPRRIVGYSDGSTVSYDLRRTQ
jgi:hypothetical protein